MDHTEHPVTALAELDKLRQTAFRRTAAAEAALAAAARLVIDTMTDPAPPDFHTIARSAGVTARSLHARLAATPGFERRLLEHLARTGARHTTTTDSK
jgi:hypothetical protein